MLPIVLEGNTVNGLFEEIAANEGFELEVDLAKQAILKPDGSVINFEIESARKKSLINGLDDISLTLLHADDIKNFEEGSKQKSPWLFA